MDCAFASEFLFQEDKPVGYHLVMWLSFWSVVMTSCLQIYVSKHAAVNIYGAVIATQCTQVYQTILLPHSAAQINS